MHGLSGAVVALAGLLAGPFILVLALYYGYGWLSETAPWTENVLIGVAAAAIGFLIAIAFTAARRIGRFPPGLFFFGATFVAVGILRWPLVPVVIGLGAASVVAAALRKRV
jgi:chromate transporter